MSSKTMLKTIETRLLSELIPYDKNPRKNGKAVDHVLESLNRHGQVKPIVISAKGRPFEQEVVCAGHTTLMALRRFGAKEAKVVVKDFADEAQFVDYNIRDNKTSEFAEWDEDILSELSGQFDINLKEMGFEFEIEEDLKEGLTDEDDVPEVPEEPTAKLGQIWKLGEHRLMCGDSTDRAQVEALMDGEKADMIYTDPPYGVKYDAEWRDKTGSNKMGAARKGKVSNDDVCNWDKAYSNFDADVVYCWHPASNTDIFKHDLEKVGFIIRSLIIWNKNIHTLSRSHYQHKHEPCWYGYKKDSRWIGDRKQMDVWDEPSPNHIMSGSKDDKTPHPTQKPIALAERAIKNHNCEIIADPFGGSGSTLIACEKTKRKCRMMELDPKYIDVIIRRWEDFTGKKSELINAV